MNYRPMYELPRGMRRLDEVEMLMLPLTHEPLAVVEVRLDLHSLMPPLLQLLNDDDPLLLQRPRGNRDEIHQAFRRPHPMADRSDPRNESWNLSADLFELS